MRSEVPVMILAVVQFGINVALIWVVFRIARNYDILKNGLEEAVQILNQTTLDSRRANREAEDLDYDKAGGARPGLTGLGTTRQGSAG